LLGVGNWEHGRLWLILINNPQNLGPPVDAENFQNLKKMCNTLLFSFINFINFSSCSAEVIIISEGYASLLPPEHFVFLIDTKKRLVKEMSVITDAERHGRVN